VKLSGKLDDREEPNRLLRKFGGVVTGWLSAPFFVGFVSMYLSIGEAFVCGHVVSFSNLVLWWFLERSLTLCVMVVRTRIETKMS